MSLSYESQPVQVEQYVERTIRQTGWVSKFRIFDTIFRVIVTRVTVELVAPDGSTVVSRYTLPTRYVETEYRKPTTVFVGVVKASESLPEASPPAEARRPEIQPTATAVRGIF